MKFSQNQVLFIIIFFLFQSCANIVAPSGGKKDERLPKVLKSEPENYSTNFQSKKITIQFDEFLNLKDVENQLIVSPTAKQNPEVKLVKKKIEIKLKDELIPNTTYTLNFGSSISDFNESNILQDFRYVFSTGDKIDSLQIIGNIQDAFSREKVKETFVLLYTDLSDSAFLKEKPMYSVRTDTGGNFKFDNIKSGTYRLVALKETNNNKIYDSKDEMIGFLNNPINLDSSINVGIIPLFKENPVILKNLDKKYENRLIYLIFNKPTKDLRYTILNDKNADEKKLAENSGDTSTIYLSSDLDSVLLEINENEKPLDTLTFRKVKKRKNRNDAEETFAFSLSKNAEPNLRPGSPLIITASRPVSFSGKKDSIILITDSVSENVLKIVSIDPSKRKLVFNRSFETGKKYSVIIPDSVLKDNSDTYNNKYEFSFSVNDLENYGNLYIKITTASEEPYVAELLDNNSKVVNRISFIKETKLSYETYTPGEYKLRIIYDTNNNGKWDTGNYLKNIQPEKVIYYSGTINLRANWDMELEYNIK